MSTHDRNEKLGGLADQAEALTGESYESPKVELWERRAREFVEREFGDDYVSILNRALGFNQVVTAYSDGQAMHRDAMAKAAIFLPELQGEDSSDIDDAKGGPPRPFLALGDLHPKIAGVCGELYVAGHLAEAVEKSFKVVRNRLRDLTGFETGSEAFGKGDLRIKGAIEPWVEDDFNEAVKFLTMAIDRFRNEKAHTADAKIDELVRAAEYLAMSSLAMRLLETGYIRRD